MCLLWESVAVLGRSIVAMLLLGCWIRGLQIASVARDLRLCESLVGR